MNLIAKRITESRKNKGLTQEELAEKSNINLRTIQRIENNESVPRDTTLNLICDVLEINKMNLISANPTSTKYSLGVKIVNGLFLVALNSILMGVFGYLTLASQDNINSKFGAVLLSFFLHFFIVHFTSKMNGIERMLKFGLGNFIYFFLIMIMTKASVGFMSGLFPCLLINVSVLYFGSKLLLSKFD